MTGPPKLPANTRMGLRQHRGPTSTSDSSPRFSGGGSTWPHSGHADSEWPVTPHPALLSQGPSRSQLEEYAELHAVPTLHKTSE